MVEHLQVLVRAYQELLFARVLGLVHAVGSGSIWLFVLWLVGRHVDGVGSLLDQFVWLCMLSVTENSSVAREATVSVPADTSDAFAPHKRKVSRRMVFCVTRLQPCRSCVYQQERQRLSCLSAP